MDLSSWDTIEEVDAANMQVFVRPGVVHYKLNEQELSEGLNKVCEEVRMKDVVIFCC